MRAVDFLLLLAFPVVASCSKKEKEPYDEPTPFDLYQAQERIRRGGLQRADTAKQIERVTTGNADHDFLRAISDHDKNVVVLSDAALELNTSPGVEAVIRRIEEFHGHDLDATSALLSTAFSDRYVSRPTDETRSTAAVLRRTETDHRRVFLDAALKSEQDASDFIDNALPKLKRADVRRVANRLRASKKAEISAIRQVLATTEHG